MSLSAARREELSRLHSNLINDVTDEMGIWDNVIPCTRIQSLWSREPVVGTAHTIQTVEIGYRKEPPEDGDEMLGFEALAAAGEGDIVVNAAPDDTQVGLWGELLSTAVAQQGAVGAVVDGPTRDSRMVEEHGFPVWCTGHSAMESYGRVDIREYDVPVEIDGVTISPGDVVFADYESIVVLEPDVVDEVTERGLELLAVEEQVRADLRDGATLTEVWDEYETL